MSNQHIQKEIEREIRKAYSGILPDEQIEATIKWWNKLASRVWKDAEREGFQKAKTIISEWVNKHYTYSENSDLDPSPQPIIDAKELAIFIKEVKQTT